MCLLGRGTHVLGIIHPFASTPPSHHMLSSGQWTGQETGHATPSMPVVIGMQISGIGQAAGSDPPGHIMCSGGHTVGQKPGQVPAAPRIMIPLLSLYLFA